MSITKKLFSLLTTIALVLGLMPAMAFAAGTASLTVTAAENNRTLEIYQVFKGDYDQTMNNLSNIQWGDSVTNSGALVAKLKNASDATVKAAFQDLADNASAADVAAKLQAATDNSELAIGFSNVVGEYFTEQGTAPVAKKTGSTGTQGDSFLYTFDNLDHGYYLLKDTTPAGTIATDNPEDVQINSRYITRVLGESHVNLKLSSRPTLDKEMKQVDDSTGAQRPGEPQHTNSATVGVGDKVHYELNTTIPDMTGYRHYQYMIEDTMSKGLTYNNDLKITFQGNDLTLNTDYTVEQTPTADGGTKIQIVFKDFLNKYKGEAGKGFKFTYTATVNKDAKVGNMGENNKAHLVFSNNPDKTSEGDPDKPRPEDPTGQTPDRTTYVYTTAVKVLKTDKNGNNLKGAEFKLTGKNLTTAMIVVVNGYTADDNGDFYKLLDGTYTQTVPNDGTKDKYEMKADGVTPQKYKASVTTRPEITSATNYAVTATVDDGGYLSFEGLLPGAYELEETKAPAGYNKLAEPIKFTVGWTSPADGNFANGCKWTLTQQGSTAVLTPQNGGTFEIKVENSQGSALPSTGGIGTTMFYVFGGILMVGALALLITKRRMHNKQ